MTDLEVGAGCGAAGHAERRADEEAGVLALHTRDGQGALRRHRHRAVTVAREHEHLAALLAPEHAWRRVALRLALEPRDPVQTHLLVGRPLRELRGSCKRFIISCQQYSCLEEKNFNIFILCVLFIVTWLRDNTMSRLKSSTLQLQPFKRSTF